MNASSDTIPCYPLLEDRISTIEHMIGINKPVPKEIYKRLKNIEDRVLYLEGVSPEYKKFWVPITFFFNSQFCVLFNSKTNLLIFFYPKISLYYSM